jgi:hypothetical protein
MTDIAEYRKAANRVLIGPGTSQRLVASVIPAILFERRHDPTTWFFDDFRFTPTTPEALAATTMTPVEITEEGASTTDFADSDTTKGMTINSPAVISERITIGPSSAGVSGTTDYWMGNLQPFIYADVMVDSDAGDMTHIDACLGFNGHAGAAPGAHIPIAASACTDCGRFLLEMGAAATNWFCETSVGGVDALYDTGILAASQTAIRLGVFLSRARKPHYFLNDRLVHVGPTVAATTMVPFFQFSSGEAATAKTFGIRYMAFGQLYSA